MQEKQALSDRAQHLFKMLVERYIQDGSPVGSRVLAREAGLSLSPATIRNVMSDLEDMGLVAAPHTSAGRIPTVDGYRLFVDSLLTVRTLNDTVVDDIRRSLSVEGDKRDLVDSASRVLSGITQMASVVMLPRRATVVLRQIEFLPMSENRVLAILVTSDGDVENRILQTTRVYSAAELVQAGNYLTQTFTGQNLAQIRGLVAAEMEEAREGMNSIMQAALEMGGEVLGGDDRDDDLVIAGQTNLMGMTDLADIERLRSLFESFNEKNEILCLLDRCMHAERAHIYIGNESGYDPLDECSLVTAPYSVGTEVVGVLGVIGPTRMAYDRVIPLVDMTARLVGSALKSR